MCDVIMPFATASSTRRFPVADFRLAPTGHQADQCEFEQGRSPTLNRCTGAGRAGTEILTWHQRVAGWRDGLFPAAARADVRARLGPDGHGELLVTDNGRMIFALGEH